MTVRDRAAFDAAWGRCEAWLFAHSPIDHAALRPPATAEEIASLEEQLGFPLHPQLRALLEHHDGVMEYPEATNHDAGAFLPVGYRLSSTDRIASQHQWLVAEAEMIAGIGGGEADPYGHAHRWVPFAQSIDGGIVFVDHHPGPAYGHVYEMGIGSGCDAVVWASSLTELFEELGACLETAAPFQGTWPTPHELPSGHFCLTWGDGLRRERGDIQSRPPARGPVILRPAVSRPFSAREARVVGRVPLSGPVAPGVADAD
ncbi:SMI1/KNR4 family protein [Streptomyces sp. NPDC006134]|uniref:SMI1/KNR4 family protein n=1 Tax=Streptomyces sp. NPDC006134 TaxID=3154467 RepID=UPI00340FF783